MWIRIKFVIFVIKLILLQNYIYFITSDKYFIRTYTNIIIFDTFDKTAAGTKNFPILPTELEKQKHLETKA